MITTVKVMLKVSRASTKDIILKTFISEHDGRSSIENKKIGYNFYVFDKRYQKNSQFPKQLEYNLNSAELYLMV